MTTSLTLVGVVPAPETTPVVWFNVRPSGRLPWETHQRRPETEGFDVNGCVTGYPTWAWMNSEAEDTTKASTLPIRWNGCETALS